MGSKSAPKPPDYAAAAQQTAQSGMTNQYTPYGSLTYAKDPNSPSGYQSTVNLSPEQQAALNQQQGLQSSQLGLAQSMLGNVGTNTAIDESRLAQMPISGQSVQDAIMARLNPQLATGDEALQSKLLNQGLMPGSEAYSNAMRMQGENKNDLYIQAALQGINTDMAARQQGLSEQYQAMNQPLNMLNALTAGTQVQNPTFNYGSPQTDYLGAANAQYGAAMGNYNAKQAGFTNNLISPLAQLGSAAFMGMG